MFSYADRLTSKTKCIHSFVHSFDISPDGQRILVNVNCSYEILNNYLVTECDIDEDGNDNDVANFIILLIITQHEKLHSCI